MKFQEKKEEVLQASTVELNQETSDRALNKSLQQEHTLSGGGLQQENDHFPTPSLNKAETVEKPITSGMDNSSVSSASDNDKIDKDFLSWVMGVKIPDMKIRDQIINVEAYARKMIKRDGDKFRAEYDAVLAEAESAKKIAGLTVQVEARVAEWQKVSDARLTVYHNLDCEPMVLLDGIEVGGADFLNKPIQVAPMVQTIPFDEEIRAQRPARMSRLKLAVKLGESPGLEFLQECWQDILLRSQVRLAIAKHPFWAVIRDDKLAIT